MAESQAGAIIAREVHGGFVQTTILLASKVDGPVESVLDTPRAMLAGLTAGVAIGLVMFVGKLLRRN